MKILKEIQLWVMAGVAALGLVCVMLTPILLAILGVWALIKYIAS